MLTIKIPAVYPNKFCSGGISQLQQPLSGLVVGIVVCLGSRRECAIGRPKINEWLHGLELLRLQHIQSARREHKVRKATVELLLEVEVVEGVDKVSPVQVSIDSEHLSEDGLADLEEVLRESTSLSDPVTVAGAAQLGKRGSGYLRVVRERDTIVVCREDGGIVNLARDPTLHESDVLVGGQLNRLPLKVEPGKGVITEID